MRTHERVLAQIEADLAAGKWALGERLPAERALAEQLGVSRPSVREAIRILEAMGIVKTAVGSGPSAGATVIDRPAAGLGAAVRLHLASGTLPVSDVVQTRTVLEAWAVGRAAARAGRAGGEGGADDGARALLTEAESLLARMSDPDLDSREFIRLDQDFHVTLTRLAGNQLVEAIMLGLRAAVGSYVAAGAERLPDWVSTRARLCVEHRGVLDAVSRGDAPVAERLVRAHIEGFYSEAGLAQTPSDEAATA
ncbi:GntR family transcriptional regulator [Antribacter sp. KLBMP9083]|uniref:GntR family transcriptional regulator n=1 Tax=Antribacter soli TaxID=2910976 RepID=A0AA41QAD7_9MICO|nr:GntR family transcriptional regulator [Antribacter soli]MCF4119482.1 GntR family transcriptional regulator [Antribacter soli]